MLVVQLLKNFHIFVKQNIISCLKVFSNRPYCEPTTDVLLCSDKNVGSRREDNISHYLKKLGCKLWMDQSGSLQGSEAKTCEKLNVAFFFKKK
jgi:hypothetical protein